MSSSEREREREQNYVSSWWQTSYNHAYGGPVESYRRENHPLMPKDNYTTLVRIKDEEKRAGKEVWRPEEVNKWGRVKDQHPLPLYQYAIGPACRAVHLTSLLLGIDLNLLEVRPEINSYKDIRNERFHLDMDPYKATPRLTSEYGDPDFPVEHRAIMKYLCKKFSGTSVHGGNRGTSLYPDGWDERRRYKIDILLDMDTRQLYPKITEFIKAVINERLVGKPGVQVPESIMNELRALNENLRAIPYLADDALSLADLAVFVTITQLELVSLDFSQFPFLFAWMQRMKSMDVFNRFNKPFVDYKSYLSGLEKL